MGGHAGLIEQDGSIRIDAACDQGSGHFTRVRGKLGWVVGQADRVEVGQEIEAIACDIVLHLDPVADRAQIIAKVQAARGLNTGNDAHLHLPSIGRLDSPDRCVFGRPGGCPVSRCCARGD